MKNANTYKNDENRVNKTCRWCQNHKKTSQQCLMVFVNDTYQKYISLTSALMCLCLCFLMPIVIQLREDYAIQCDQ